MAHSNIPIGSKDREEKVRVGCLYSIRLFIFQILGLCLKSLLTIHRSIIGIAVAVIVPALFMRVVVTSVEDSLQNALNALNESADPFQYQINIPKCTVGKHKSFCKSLVYFPADDEDLKTIAHVMAQTNNPPLSEGAWDDVNALVSPSGFDPNLEKQQEDEDTHKLVGDLGWNENLNTTLAVLVKDADSGNIYIRYNETIIIDPDGGRRSLRVRLSYLQFFRSFLRGKLQLLADKALLPGGAPDMSGFNETPNIDVKLYKYEDVLPSPPGAIDPTKLVMRTIFGLIAGPIICAATSAILIPSLLVATEEKVEKVVEYYSLLGVKRVVYLFSKLITSAGIGLLTGTAMNIFETSTKTYMLGANVSWSVRYTVYAMSGFLWSIYGFWLSGKPKNRKKAISRGIQRFTLYFIMNMMVYIVLCITKEFTKQNFVYFMVLVVFIPSYAILVLCAVVAIQASADPLKTFGMTEFFQDFPGWDKSAFGVSTLIILQCFWLVIYYQWRVTAKGYDGSTKQGMLFWVKPSYWKAIFRKRAEVPEESKLIMTDASPDVLRERKKASSKTSKALLRIVNLTKVYESEGNESDSKLAVGGISFVVDRGDIVFLAGPSGSGKTSTLSCIAGVSDITSGSILVDGVDTIGRVNSRMAFLPQDPSYFKGVSGLNNIRIGMLFGGHLPLGAMRFSEKVSLSRNEIVRNIDTYSGGMKKRVALATTIATLPPRNGVLVLDECTTGVDIHTRTALWGCISQLSRDHAILLSSHALQEGEELATKVILMTNGVISAIGSPKYLARKYQTYPRLIVRSHEELRALKALARHIPAALRNSLMVSQDTSGALVIVLNRMARTQTEKLLEDLENDPDFGKYVNSHGLASASLQSVFIAITTGGRARITSKEEGQEDYSGPLMDVIANAQAMANSLPASSDDEPLMEVVSVDESSAAIDMMAAGMKHPYRVYSTDGEIFAVVDIRPKFVSFEELSQAIRASVSAKIEMLGGDFMFGMYDQASEIVPLLCSSSDNLDMTVGDRPVFVIPRTRIGRGKNERGDSILMKM